MCPSAGMGSLLLALVLSVACGSPATWDGPAPPLDKVMKAGLHRQKLDLGDGATMRYSVSVPELEAGAKVPLVLALHYGGPVTPHYGEDYMKVLVLPGLDELQAVFVAPDCPGNGWADPVSEAAGQHTGDCVDQSAYGAKGAQVIIGSAQRDGQQWYAQTHECKNGIHYECQDVEQRLFSHADRSI